MKVLTGKNARIILNGQVLTGWRECPPHMAKLNNLLRKLGVKTPFTNFTYTWTSGVPGPLKLQTSVDAVHWVDEL